MAEPTINIKGIVKQYIYVDGEIDVENLSKEIEGIGLYGLRALVERSEPEQAFSLIAREYIVNLVNNATTERGKDKDIELSEIKKGLKAIGYNEEQADRIINRAKLSLRRDTRLSVNDINVIHLRVRAHSLHSTQDIARAFTDCLVSEMQNIRSNEKKAPASQIEGGGREYLKAGIKDNSRNSAI